MNPTLTGWASVSTCSDYIMRVIKTATVVEQTGGLVLQVSRTHYFKNCTILAVIVLPHTHSNISAGGSVHESSDSVQLYPHSLYKFLTLVWWQIVYVISPSAHLHCECFFLHYILVSNLFRKEQKLGVSECSTH